MEEFSVRVLSPGDLPNGISRETKHAPTILLCVKGRVCISSAPDSTAPERVELQAGEAAWVPASAASYTATAIHRARAHPIAATLYEVSLG